MDGAQVTEASTPVASVGCRPTVGGRLPATEEAVDINPGYRFLVDIDREFAPTRRSAAGTLLIPCLGRAPGSGHGRGGH